MGGSSSKRTFVWQKKKKKSPLDNALGHLKGALPGKKRKKKSKVILKKLHLDKVKKKKKQSQKKFSLSAVKRLSVGEKRKDSTHSASPGRKEEDRGGGGLGNIGEQMKKRLSLPLEKIRHMD